MHLFRRRTAGDRAFRDEVAQRDERLVRPATAATRLRRERRQRFDANAFRCLDAHPDVPRYHIEALADLAAEINSSVENIGARRLHTVMERLLEDISFTATDRAGATVTIDAKYVQERVAPLAKNADLSKFIL